MNAGYLKLCAVVFYPPCLANREGCSCMPPHRGSRGYREMFKCVYAFRTAVVMYYYFLQCRVSTHTLIRMAEEDGYATFFLTTLYY